MATTTMSGHHHIPRYDNERPSLRITITAPMLGQMGFETRASRLEPQVSFSLLYFYINDFVRIDFTYE